MTINLCNNSIEPIIIGYNKMSIFLNPNETRKIDCDLSNCSIRIQHVKNDKLSVLWYIMNEVFTLEQMRTVLVVNGEYEISDISDNSTVRILSHEYVFEKNTSYQTFIFSADGCYIIRKQLEVDNSKKISTKARILYLFGGNRTVLPLSGIAFISSLFKLIGANEVPIWFFTMTLGLGICFILFLIRYLKSLKKLDYAMKNANILKYLSSQRKEYRKFTDEIVQEYFDVNKSQDLYN